MNFLKNVKFVRKIQGGYTLLGMIAGMSLLLQFFQLSGINDANEEVVVEYVKPKNNIDHIHTNFRSIQFIMLQMSMPEFESKFADNYAAFNEKKAEVDSTFSTLLNGEFDAGIKDQLKAVNGIWGDYKSIVADAIVSASVTKNFMMAADIATTSGEELGSEMLVKFDGILKDLAVKADRLNANIDSNVAKAELVLILTILLGTSIYLISTFYLAPYVSKPLNKINNLLKDFSLGNYNHVLIKDSNDEIGELTESLIALRDAQQEKINVAEDIVSGKFTKVEPASDADALAHAFNKVVDITENITREAAKIVEANRNGNLEVRGNSKNFSGSWQQLIDGINSILETIVLPLNESAEILNAMAKGDFTRKIEGNYKGYYAQMKNNVNQLADSLNVALSEVAESANLVMQTANEISSSSEQMAAGAQEQTTQAAEVSTSVDEMTRTILENTKNASFAAETAKESGSKAHEGGSVVEETITGMMRIADVVEESARTVEQLGKNSDQIGEIIQVIDDIADQTNLLALNAAIEAARAGEQGRGFAVVADEVRKLAERTTKATKEIADMIKQIQNDTSNAVSSMKQGTEEVEKGKGLASRASSVLQELITGASKVVDIAVQVAAASEEQSSSAELISKNIEGIAKVTEQSAVGTQQIARSSEELLNMTEKLQKLIARFKINAKTADKYAVRSNGKIISYNNG
ncbi:MAG: HAMP domain-containing protein [Melioribacteraceae bacterium]|nr:HAMP domain-containing protein [Melioribacteraceae bacterium]